MDKSTLKIVISGPESTGKTELSQSLAGLLGTDFIPEFARAYVEGLKRPYTYEDLEHIAGVQRKKLAESLEKEQKIILMDTYLVITKIWFLEVYGRMPGWLDNCLKESAIDLFLLCYYDIEWKEDPVRENPGLKRKYLFEKYRQEINSLGVPCELVKGRGEERIQNAYAAVIKHFPDLKTN